MKKINIYSTMFNWQKTKMKMKKISSANQQLSAFGNATGINAFKIIKNVYPLPLKANHQIFSILTTCQIFFSYLGTRLLEIVLRSKLLYGNMSRYAGINITENMVDNRSLSINETTNFQAELYFHLKKLDQNKINLPLCKYIKENSSFCIALQWQFIGKCCKNGYLKGPTKW